MPVMCNIICPVALEGGKYDVLPFYKPVRVYRDIINIIRSPDSCRAYDVIDKYYNTHAMSFPHIAGFRCVTHTVLKWGPGGELLRACMAVNTRV